MEGAGKREGQTLQVKQRDRKRTFHLLSYVGRVWKDHHEPQRALYWGVVLLTAAFVLGLDLISLSLNTKKESVKK